MTCKCGSVRILAVGGKASDLCVVSIVSDGEVYEHDGYVPSDINIGGGDYIELDICLDCGTVQGDWPLTDAAVLEALK